MKERALLFAAVLLVAGRIGGQEAPPKEVPQYSLRAMETVPVAIQDNGFWDSAQCDQDGYVYWRAATAGDFESDPVWKIYPKWDRYTEFSMPKELVEEELRLRSFTVAADGTLYGIAHEYRKGQVFLVRFDSYGQVSSKTKLAVPKRLLPNLVAVFPKGETLVYGRLDEETPPGQEEQVRLAIYSEDGRLLSPVRLPKGKASEQPIEKKNSAANEPASQEPKESESGILPRGAVAMGDDGNAYLLLGTEIVVVSVRGEVVRTIPLTDIPSGFAPTNIQSSRGILSVKFTKGKVNAAVEAVRFRTIEAGTGSVQADYVPESDLGTTPVCFTANEGYRFYVFKEKKGYIARGWIQ